MRMVYILTDFLHQGFSKPIPQATCTSTTWRWWVNAMLDPDRVYTNPTSNSVVGPGVRSGNTLILNARKA